MPPVFNIYDALIFMTEYTLITVTCLCTKKSATEYETSRQIAIAQMGIDSIIKEKIAFELLRPLRVIEVINQYNGSVESWAKSWAKKYKSQGEAK